MTHFEKITALKNRIFEGDNKACFIEREHYLNSIKEKVDNNNPKVFAGLLDYVSTPVEEYDVFVGNAVESRPDFEGECPSRKLSSLGHMNPNYEKLLKLGYKGILEEVEANANRIGTKEALEYFENSKIVVEAIHKFALRYAESAKEKGNMKAYNALLKVPYEPAYDLYSALQGIWFAHFIASCYIGSRDYAFGYMDEYLYPFFLKEKENGVSDQDIIEMLSGFYIKTNEICGRTTHNYAQKPIHCHSSKQYVLLDGGKANELSVLMLEAVKYNCMPQPETTVILSKASSDDFKAKVYDALSVLTDKLQVYNFELMRDALLKKGLPDYVAERPAYSACCTFDLNYHSVREEYYFPTVEMFCETIFNNEFSSKDELLKAYSDAITAHYTSVLANERENKSMWQRRSAFLMDALLIGNCNDLCSYPPNNLEFRSKQVFITGIATLGDSLCALDKMVFSGKMEYSEFIKMLKADFKDYEDKLLEIKAIEKFGNDSKNDAYATEIGTVIANALHNAKHESNEYIMPSFYTLTRENDNASRIPATPDGRRAGTPYSENQSPTYGADKKGITALLNSVSKLPFDIAFGGGLNLTFSQKQSGEILKALTTAYFENGGLHVGITVLDRAELEDAMVHPEKYPALTVRLYGFSEYFISLPEWQQRAVINRTAYL